MYDVMHVRPGLLLLLWVYCSFIVYKNRPCSNSLVYCLYFIVPYRELGFMSIHSLLSHRRSYIQFCATQFHHSSTLAHWMFGLILQHNPAWWFWMWSVTSRVHVFVLFCLLYVTSEATTNECLFIYMFAFVFVVYQTAASLSQKAGGLEVCVGGGGGRKAVQEGCSCVNRSSVLSPPLSPNFMSPPVPAGTGSTSNMLQMMCLRCAGLLWTVWANWSSV